MLTKEENAELTRVGPSTPCGELLRRYWHPIAAAKELTPERPKKRVRLLGEDLVIFQEPDGGYGLVGEPCPHRGCSLYYGFLEDGGIRCPYHGWLYDAEGRCLEQPFEPPQSMLKHTIHHTAYPVQKIHRLLFAYMGPAPAPFFPPWDVVVRQDGTHSIDVHPVIEANWLQVMETNVDPVHNHFLHHYMRIYKGLPWHGDIARDAMIEDLDFQVCEWGVIKRRVYGGPDAQLEDGHPALFPNVLRHSGNGPIDLHWRTPIDDTHSQTFWLGFEPSADGSIVEEEDDPPVEYIALKDEEGSFTMDTNASQDSMAWETQGALRDRTVEHLGASDRGVVVFRNLLKEQIDKVRRGEEPMGIIRDPSKYPIISFSHRK